MSSSLRDKLGICQWFHYETYRDVERAVRLMQELGVKHVRTGISWADWHRPNGPAWYDFQMDALSDFDVLVSIWHTPPSIAEGGTCASPPARLEDFAEFIDVILQRHGDQISTLELWNEPNNHLKWDFKRFDTGWRKFGDMIRMGGEAARRGGMPTVLGGMIPVDHYWLQLMASYGALDAVDAVGIHGFPHMWWKDFPNWDWYRHWKGWDRKIGYIAEHARNKPIWVTETGLATWDLPNHHHGRYDLQVDALEKAASAPAERVYWYCLEDLDPWKHAIEGFHVDENEYHLGLVAWNGERKPAWYRMKDLLERPARTAQIEGMAHG